MPRGKATPRLLSTHLYYSIRTHAFLLEMIRWIERNRGSPHTYRTANRSSEQAKSNRRRGKKAHVFYEIMTFVRKAQYWWREWSSLQLIWRVGEGFGIHTHTHTRHTLECDTLENDTRLRRLHWRMTYTELRRIHWSMTYTGVWHTLEYDIHWSVTYWSVTHALAS